MKEPILKFNRTLPVNDDQHGWSLREKKILEVWTNCVLEKAAAYKEAIEMMASCVYPLIILSPMVLHLSNLLQLAQSRSLPMSVLVAATLIRKLWLAFRGCWLKPASLKKKPGGIVSPFSGTAAHVSEFASLFSRMV
jgi:hypothetical protein